VPLPRPKDADKVFLAHALGIVQVMFLLRPPGVYRANSDTSLLIDVLREGRYASGRHVLDIGTGTGALAVAAARTGAVSITAVDVSLRSVAATWLNSRLHGVSCTVHHGDLFNPVANRRFDLIMANPPYVPAATSTLPRHGVARCWDGGLNGRAVVDRICTEGPSLLTPGGMLLLVHSAICDIKLTLSYLTGAGLRSQVLARCTVPFGPVMRLRAAMLQTRGLIKSGQRDEELVVIGASRAC
jgi:release factor glutamine methyltransferase